MTVSSTMLVLNKAVLKAIPAPTTGTVTLDLYALVQAQPLVRAYLKSSTSPHASPLSLIPSPMSPTFRFPRFPKRHHSARITLNRYPKTSFPRFPKLLQLCINASALLFQIGSSRALSLSLTHTHSRARTYTRARAHTHTHTHSSVTVSSRVLSYYLMGSRENG